MRRSRASVFRVTLGLLLLLSSGVCFWQGWAWWRWAIAPMTSAGEIQLQIPSGTTSLEIGEHLQRAGLIRSTKAWKVWSVYLRLSDRHGSYKAGTYELGFNQSLPAIADTIWQGKVLETSVTIPEGWSLRQMGDYFESLGWFSAETFLQTTKKIPKDKFTWLPQDITQLEGFLYPDTYFVTSDRPKPEVMINQMLKRFEQVALPLYKEAQKNNKIPLKLTLNEWVTLSSIVEKEAVVAPERSRISGVFLNRLERGMKLETDPTVEYSLNIRQTPDKPLTLTQIKTPSPYNTYVNTGLPPGAIAAPGLASLKAVLNPEKTDALFFVAKYDGTHVFSKTLEEHEAATKKIREVYNQAQQQSTPKTLPN